MKMPRKLVNGQLVDQQRSKTDNTYFDDTCKNMFRNTCITKVKKTDFYILTLARTRSTNNPKNYSTVWQKVSPCKLRKWLLYTLKV